MNILKSFTTLSLLSCLGYTSLVFAQDQSDALRYSYLTPQGTARSMGFGSALGSIGGDFSSLSINPAGIGVYRSSELVFTPSLKFSRVDSRYLGQTEDDGSARLNFNNLGVVFTQAEKGRRYERNSWKTISFGVGMNRLADFNRNYQYSGLMKGRGNEYSSFSEVFVADARANGTNGNLGWEGYLIDYDSTTGSYFAIPNWETGLNQLKDVRERGGINELVISLGGNYEEKLMLGATLGLPFLSYNRSSYFQEKDASGDTTNSFASFGYSEELKASGVGVNLKLGLIYKPHDQFRIGAAIHTPTWYGLRETFNENLSTNMESFHAPLKVSNPENQFEYNLTTPWRAVFSAAGILGTYGFITADYEYVDYQSARFHFENSFSEAERVRNRGIKNSLQGASNLRIGIEGRMDQFQARAGFGYYGNPYKNSGQKMTREDISFGLGYRSDDFFADLAFVHGTLNQTERAYNLEEPVVPPSAKLTSKINSFTVTFGVKF
jgi:hypothetical protein